MTAPRRRAGNVHRRHVDATPTDPLSPSVADFWWQRSTMAQADQVSFHTTAATAILDRLMASAQPGDFEFVPI
jgi:hypothetical protein